MHRHCTLAVSSATIVNVGRVCGWIGRVCFPVLCVMTLTGHCDDMLPATAVIAMPKLSGRGRGVSLCGWLLRGSPVVCVTAFVHVSILLRVSPRGLCRTPTATSVLSSGGRSSRSWRTLSSRSHPTSTRGPRRWAAYLYRSLLLFLGYATCLGLLSVCVCVRCVRVLK